MRIYDRYVIWLATLFGLTTVVLSMSSRSLDIYLSLYLVECLALTLMFSHLRPEARKGLNRIGYVLFVGFVFMVAVKVVEMASGAKVL